MEWLDNLKKLKDTTTETYKSISEKTKIPQTTIEKIFSGRTKDPKLFMIKEVVHCLGYTLDDLLDENENKYDKLSTVSIQDKYDSLNEYGKQKVNEYINDLTENPKYTSNKTSHIKPFSLHEGYEIAAWGADGTEGTFETPEEEIT